MNNKNRQPRQSKSRLRVRKEILRNLSTQDLSQAQGGLDLGIPNIYHFAPLFGPCQQSNA